MYVLNRGIISVTRCETGKDVRIFKDYLKVAHILYGEGWAGGVCVCPGVLMHLTYSQLYPV